MELVLIRHGESEANGILRTEGGFYCGRWDCDLTARGRAQAEALKGSAALLGAGAVYASPLRRAVETAAAFAAREILLDERLTERTMGAFDGKRRAELETVPEYRKYFTEEPFTRFRCSFTVSAPGGETYADVLRRVEPFLRDLKETGLGKAVVVSHHVAIRCMVMAVRDLTEEETLRLEVPNCEPIVLAL